MTMEYPDGFEVMTETAQKQAFQDENPDRAGIWDKQRHVMVAVLWHTTNKLLIAIAGNAKWVAQSNEARISKALRNHGYQKGDFFETDIAGHKAHGFSYEYSVQGVTQSCRIVSVINEVTCYNIYLYGRKENAENDLKLFEELLRTTQFK